MKVQNSSDGKKEFTFSDIRDTVNLVAADGSILAAVERDGILELAIYAPPDDGGNRSVTRYKLVNGDLVPQDKPVTWLKGDM